MVDEIGVGFYEFRCKMDCACMERDACGFVQLEYMFVYSVLNRGGINGEIDGLGSIEFGQNDKVWTQVTAMNCIVCEYVSIL
mmetsp:Transcript_7826/g.14204  ORF Transcript_7826/g.14204 Transcript_7826/m.14204 type:complete len:82 (+) Transcript_7826:112-357(+)